MAAVIAALAQYATVCPYIGKPELLRWLGHFMPWLLAGAGFGVVMLANKALRRGWRQRARRARQRRLWARETPGRRAED